MVVVGARWAGSRIWNCIALYAGLAHVCKPAAGVIRLCIIPHVRGCRYLLHSFYVGLVGYPPPPEGGSCCGTAPSAQARSCDLAAQCSRHSRSSGHSEYLLVSVNDALWDSIFSLSTLLIRRLISCVTYFEGTFCCIEFRVDEPFLLARFELHVM